MYIFISSLIFFFSLLFWTQDRDSIAIRYTFLFLLLLLIFLDGFRWNIGTDWTPYYVSFISHSVNPHFEKGYALFSSTISSLTDNYTFFILIIAIIQYFALAFFIQKYSISPLISLCIAYCIYLPLLGMNRQFIALSITLVSIVFIIKRKFLLYFLLIVCASCFHKTALFFLPAYLLWNLQLDKKIIISVLVVSAIIGVFGALNFLPLEYINSLIGEKDENHLRSYLALNTRSSMLNGLLFRVFIIVPCLFITIPDEYKKEYNFFFNMYLVSVLMYVLFQNSTLNVFAGRGAFYYSISVIILIPYILKYLFQNVIFDIFYWIIFFLLYLWIMEKDINGYSIKLGIDIFRPYQNVLFPDGLF